MLRSSSILIVMLLLVSCATQRTASVETSVHDTTYIERVTTYRDTVYYAQIPPESHESVTDDTLSILRTVIRPVRNILHVPASLLQATGDREQEADLPRQVLKHESTTDFQ